MTRERSVGIAAKDGFRLAGSIFEPAGEARGVVLVSPATAVHRRLYRRFAEHLAERGFCVVTWDWRGTGDSRPGVADDAESGLDGFDASLLHWARLDLGGVIRWAEERWPQQPLHAVGHSFGGQCLGLCPEASRLTSAVTVAAQSGYWGHWPWPGRVRYGLIWWVVMPLVVAGWGYFPGRFLGMGEDLPAGVARQWAHWCRTPEYLGAHEGWDGHRSLDIPIHAYAVTDDVYAPRAAVEALHRHYGGLVGIDDLAPEDVGRERIGHFGMFKPGVPALWDAIAERFG